MRVLGPVIFLFVSGIVGCGGGSSSEAPTSASSAADSGVPSSSTSDAGSGGSPSDDGGHTDASTPATQAATGTVGGHAFTHAHGIAIPKTVGGAPGYEIFLSDSAIDCTNATLEGSTTLDVGVAGQPPAAKTYSVIDAFAQTPGANEAYADFNVLDATCGSVLSDSSKSGTLVLTKFDAAKVEGSIDITFQSNARIQQGNVAGTFEAIVCPKFPAITCTPH
jgi:hypothetical protein